MACAVGGRAIALGVGSAEPRTGLWWPSEWPRCAFKSHLISCRSGRAETRTETRQPMTVDTSVLRGFVLSLAPAAANTRYIVSHPPHFQSRPIHVHYLCDRGFVVTFDSRWHVAVQKPTRSYFAPPLNIALSPALLRENLAAVLFVKQCLKAKALN